mmetsp:Transcript_24457/g.43351  ORF Transcript_24457/g.43351 Transcript_24457/m.43351 type:complete len:188 (+) Transcript_24457:402-965(+)
MQVGDYWDIDDFLTEEEEVNVLTAKHLSGIGSLVASMKSKDLTVNTKVLVPYWLAVIWTQRSLAVLEIPKFYKEAYRESLRADPDILRLADKSRYFFELGTKLAILLADHDLNPVLYSAFMSRFKYIVTHFHHTATTSFMRSLTQLELKLLDLARSGNEMLKRWRERRTELIECAIPTASGKRSRHC